MSAACALAACLAAGCSSVPWRKVPLDAASGFYAEAGLTYRLDAGKLGQPLDVVRVEGQRVSHEQVASSPLVGESIGTLSVIYPHPSGRAGYALARFTLDSAHAQSAAPKKSWNPFGKKPSGIEPPTGIAGGQPEVHETWELDIAAGESEQLFKLLTNLGYYTSDRPGGGAQLAVKLNGSQQSKEWDQVPALNLLIQRVRAQGRLMAYVRPGGSSGSGVATIASTGEYGKLLAAQGVAAANPAANAFSLAPPVWPATVPQAPAFPPVNPAGLAQRPPVAPR